MDRDIHGDQGAMQEPGGPLFNIFPRYAVDFANVLVREAFNEADILPELMEDGYHEITRLVNRLFYYWKIQLGHIQQTLDDGEIGTFELTKRNLEIQPETVEEYREEKRHEEIAVAAYNVMFLARTDIKRYILNFPCLHEHSFIQAGKKLLLTFIHWVNDSNHDVPDRLIMSCSILMHYYFFYSDFAKRQRMDPINLWIDFFLIHFLKQSFDNNLDTVDVWEAINERYNVASLTRTPHQDATTLPNWGQLLNTFKQLAEVRYVPWQLIIQREIHVRRQVLPYFKLMDPGRKMFHPDVSSDDDDHDNDDDDNDDDSDDSNDTEEEFIQDVDYLLRHLADLGMGGRRRRRRPTVVQERLI